LQLPPELLERAFQNTVTLLKEQVVVVDGTVDEVTYWKQRAQDAEDRIANALA
jgi:hypothetical protein